VSPLRLDTGAAIWLAEDEPTATAGGHGRAAIEGGRALDTRPRRRRAVSREDAWKTLPVVPIPATAAAIRTA